MSKIEVYPKWDDIKSELNRLDLIEIIEEHKGDVDEYIKANYEPTYEEDTDTAYEQFKEKYYE